MEIIKNKGFRIIFVLVGFTISFLFGFFSFKNKYKLIDVPVASSYLDRRSVIKNKDIDYIKMPKNSIDEGVILDENLLIGKYIKSDYYLNKGALFYSSFIEDEGSMNDIDYLDLDSNSTIYELFINNVSANAAHLNKNMYVDLYLTLDKPSVMSELLISGAKICGLYNNNYEELNENNKNNNLSIISLVIDKDMVSLLNKGVMLGEVSIIPCSNPYDEKDCFINRKGDIINYLN